MIGEERVWVTDFVCRFKSAVFNVASVGRPVVFIISKPADRRIIFGSSVKIWVCNCAAKKNTKNQRDDIKIQFVTKRHLDHYSQSFLQNIDNDTHEVHFYCYCLKVFRIYMHAYITLLRLLRAKIKLKERRSLDISIENIFAHMNNFEIPTIENHLRKLPISKGHEQVCRKN